jgi:hypothetical protein
MVANGHAVVGNTFNFSADNTLWRKLSSPDVLRHGGPERNSISMDGLPVNWRGMVAAHYMDTAGGTRVWQPPPAAGGRHPVGGHGGVPEHARQQKPMAKAANPTKTTPEEA